LKEITLDEWVSGHIGILGNKIAEKLEEKKMPYKCQENQNKKRICFR